MRLGILSDIHLGFSRGRKVNNEGINVREQDVYYAAERAVENLIDAGAEAILDLGDIAEVPMPKKRAISELVKIIGIANFNGLPWYSINGNHTLTRAKTDIELLTLLKGLTEDFFPVLEPTFISDLDILAIPYGSSESIREGLGLLDRYTPIAIAGHWAASDVPFEGDHISTSLLPYQIPTFLGHYHTRTYDEDRNPIYIGSTERFKWGEHKNPTGAAIYDTDTQELDFIDHPTREWVDLRATSDNYLDVLDTDIEDKIVRLKVDTDPFTFNRLDRRTVFLKAESALEFTFSRDRVSDHELVSIVDPISNRVVNLEESWKEFMNRQGDIPTRIRKSVEENGLRLLGAK